MAFDYKKEYKEFYVPKNKPSIVEVPKMNYIAVRGKGNPNNENSEYKDSIGLLYAIAFTIKMSYKGTHKINGYFEYVVPPLEGFWWQEGNKNAIDYKQKDKFNFISIIRLPEFVTKEDFDWAIEEATNKKKQDFSKVELLSYDEVQMCKEFERTINSLHAEEKYDIYITGSNAFLLSSDLATLFTGRTYEIQIYPFSFKEYMQYFNYENIQDAFEKYVFEGGMSGSYIYNDNKKKYNYINEVYNALIVRDIQQKYNIQNIGLMDNLTEFMMDNISNLTSYRNIANKLNENNVNTNDKTVANYINYLCDAFAFYKIRRYDIQGKRYLSSVDKYYLVDQTFKYAKLGTKNVNYGRIYENIVAIELLRRGYEVYVGELYNFEVDFVAMKRNEKLYIQVSDNISDDKTLEREVRPLLKIKDAYPKILISRTRHDDYQYEGIQIYDIANWLLK